MHHRLHRRRSQHVMVQVGVGLLVELPDHSNVVSTNDVQSEHLLLHALRLGVDALVALVQHKVRHLVKSLQLACAEECQFTSLFDSINLKFRVGKIHNSMVRQQSRSSVRANSGRREHLRIAEDGAIWFGSQHGVSVV